MAPSPEREIRAVAAALSTQCSTAPWPSPMRGEREVPQLVVGLAQVWGEVVLKPRLEVCPTVIKASVVILTWNSTEMLSACLTSLPQSFAAHPYEVIVVDNGSRGLIPAALQKEFPWIQLLVNRRNRGVAPARNQGIRVAQGEYVILLDDDTVVQAGAFDRLLTYMDEHPEVGLCGPRLIDPQGQLQ